MPDLAIQIVNYKTKDYLPDLIEGIISDLWGTRLNYKILILDNNSGDDLSEIEDKFHHNVEIFYSSQNYGFGSGHNILAEKNDSQYILILNPDIKFIEKGTIKSLLERLEKNPSYKIIGPKLLLPGETAQPWDHGELKGPQAQWKQKIGRSHWKEGYSPISAAWVAGTFLLIERTVFQELNGFDQNFFLYKEEEDLCLRARKNNFKVIYDPTVKVVHYGLGSEAKDDHLHKSNEYFLQKHFSDKPYYGLLRLLQKISP